MFSYLSFTSALARVGLRSFFVDDSRSKLVLIVMFIHGGSFGIVFLDVTGKGSGMCISFVICLSLWYIGCGKCGRVLYLCSCLLEKIMGWVGLDGFEEIVAAYFKIRSFL